MPRLLRYSPLTLARSRRASRLVCCAGVLVFVLTLGATPAEAGYGGGYGGSGGNAIWALAWWAGNPEGPGPFIGPPAEAAGRCIWHDVGGSTAGLATALSESSLPKSFLTAPLGGSHPGISGVLLWASSLVRRASSTDHFDLVACPSPSLVPAGSADVETDFPLARPPRRKPLWIWVFWDTVADPPANSLPPVIDEALGNAHLRPPAISTSPSDVAGVADSTVVNVPTWLWIDPSVWRQRSATAAAGPIVATVWADPVTVTWTANWDFGAATDDPEHGTTLGPESLATSCPGPGIAYSYSELADGSRGACTAVFTEPTLGTTQALHAAITWTVHWAVSSTSGVVGGEGLLPPSSTSSAAPLRVMQVESIIASG
ncbi:MAG: hypothetical protein ACLQK4_13720 [Acidimicrobiales bacterium]